MKHSRHATLLRFLLALVVLAGLPHWFGDARDRFRLGLHPDQFARRPFRLDPDTRKGAELEPEAVRAGLPAGAMVESLNGAPYTGYAQWYGIVNQATPGDQLLVGYRRPNGSAGSATVIFAPRRPGPGDPVGLGQTLQQALLFDCMPLLCMLIGYWVVFVKADEPNAWLLLALLLFPESVMSNTVGLSAGGWLCFRVLYHSVIQALGPPALLLFAVFFPERSRFDRKLPWLKWAVAGPVFFCGLAVTLHFLGQLYLPSAPPAFLRAASLANHAGNALSLLCVALYFVLLLEKAQSASTADARRRLRVLLLGTGVGLLALLSVFVLLPALGYALQAPNHVWVGYLGAALFLFAPLTLAYVVLVQRAMDVRVLLRQGTRYALARATVVGVQAVLGVGVAWYALAPLWTQQQISRSQLAHLSILLALILLLRVLLAKRLMTALDRKFFREAYDSERVLSDLAAEVRRYTESGPLLRTVSRCVADTLHVSRISMLLREGQEFRVVEAVGGIPINAPALPLTSSAIRRLTNRSAAAELHRDAPEAWYLLAGQREQASLDELGAELLLALPGRDRLIGVMALGPKQSEAAYSRSDLRLLESLAGQTGMALEISELAQSLAREAAVRERATRELEIAREVQERLFPQSMPTLAAGTIAGFCRPAQDVGGDYYDVFPLEDGRLGLAIGDVSGKGISAALLMSSLRASLRSTLMDSPSDFARVMDKVNRLIYEASTSSRYATFFFGALHPETLLLECVNAGHNPPMVLRERAGAEPEILRLPADGPVVGLLPGAAYSAQRLHLQPGDLLVAYTDGISEAMNDEYDEWGEERMLQSALGFPASSASAALATIFEAADAFTAGAEQNDDMTLLILQLNSRQADPSDGAEATPARSIR